MAEKIACAYEKIKQHICLTPLEHSVSLSNLGESSVYLKV